MIQLCKQHKMKKLNVNGAVRNRTADFLHAKQALYQLSYSPSASQVVFIFSIMSSLNKIRSRTVFVASFNAGPKNRSKVKPFLKNKKMCLKLCGPERLHYGNL